MAWENISSNHKERLLEVRNKIGMDRQTSLTTDFKRLLSVLEIKSLHPFGKLGAEVFEELNNCCISFKEGGQWEIGDALSSVNFYRIENLESFLNKHNREFSGYAGNPDVITINTDVSSPEDIFNRLIKEYKKDQTWQPLKRLTPHYISYRSISWWTNDFTFNKDNMLPQYFDGCNLSVLNKWLLNFAFNVGISSDWLSENILFLKLDGSKMTKDCFRIPSIIDALLQPIFSPQTFKEEQRWGLAFDLNEDIKPMYREYVLKNIPIDAVEYIPVKINLHTIDKINPKARLNDSLIEALIQNI